MLGQRGADARGDFVARALARGAGGSIATLLRRGQREGHVRGAGTAAPNDGAGAADA